MDPESVAIKILSFLASGGTVAGLRLELPAAAKQIDGALLWLEKSGRCPAAEVEARAKRLGELAVQMFDALKRQDFDTAANVRARECAVYESFRLEPPKGESHTILFVGVAEQTKDLSIIFNEAKAT